MKGGDQDTVGSAGGIEHAQDPPPPVGLDHRAGLIGIEVKTPSHCHPGEVIDTRIRRLRSMADSGARSLLADAQIEDAIGTADLIEELNLTESSRESVKEEATVVLDRLSDIGNKRTPGDLVGYEAAARKCPTYFRIGFGELAKPLANRDAGEREMAAETASEGALSSPRRAKQGEGARPVLSAHFHQRTGESSGSSGNM